MQIKIYEKVSQQPNGDRDRETHPCSSFRVVLVKDDQKTVIFENSQFDHFWTSIKGTRQEYLNEAMKKAEELAKTLGAVEIVGVQTTKYELELSELEKRIAKDTKRAEYLRSIL